MKITIFTGATGGIGAGSGRFPELPGPDLNARQTRAALNSEAKPK